MRTFLLIAVFFFMKSTLLLAQTSYSGYLDKYPIEFIIHPYYSHQDGSVNAIYSYTKYGSPIVVNGDLKNKKLTLYEKDDAKKDKAILIFEQFDTKNSQLIGTWTDLESKKQLKITLDKTFSLEGNGKEWSNREIIQPVSLKNHYFKLIVSNDNEGFSSPYVAGIKILEKKTHKLIQQIELGCQLWGIENVSVGDYNFDGFDDFSVFEGTYAGPDTSSLYFLYDPKKKIYFDSGYSGSSLQFDYPRKRIYGHSQCCAGSRREFSEYKVVNNKMVLIKITCSTYDEKIGGLKSIPCK